MPQKPMPDGCLNEKQNGLPPPLRQKPTEKERNKDEKRMLRITEN